MFSRLRATSGLIKRISLFNNSIHSSKYQIMRQYCNKTYTESDEWLFREDHTSNQYRIGLSKNASELLGELVYIEFNFEDGDEFNVDEDLVFIESVKAANSIKAPFNGIIVKNNNEIEGENLGIINDNPECTDESWFCEIKKVD